MDTKQIENWSRSFVADLSIGDVRVPVDRVVAMHLQMILSLRSKGLTWRALAEFLTRAGARQGDGKPISVDQLRANVSRQLRRIRQRAERTVDDFTFS